MTQNQSLFDKLSSNVSWLLDSRATRHMTRQDNYLFNVFSVLPCYIGLLNDSEYVVIMEGSVHLDPNFVLTHVLFVPDLKSNLISVPQLLQSNYFVSTAKEVFVIQDYAMMKVIGASRLIDGVYHF